MWPTSATPSTTARATKRIQHEGLGCELIPAPVRWKLTRRRATEAELKEIVDNGSFMLPAGQQESHMAAMVANFCPLLATGATLADMFGSSSRSKRATRTAPPPAPASKNPS